MTAEQVREIIRLEMRELRRVLWDARTSNHDAQEAIEKVRQALDTKFPQSPTEFADEIDDYTIDRCLALGTWDLERIGGRLAVLRLDGETDDEYADRLKAQRAELLRLRRKGLFA